MSIVCRGAIFLPPLLALSATAGGVKSSTALHHGELSIQIYQPEFGNLYQKGPNQILPVTANPLEKFQVVIKNIFRGYRDVYRAGNSFGDGALSLDVLATDGRMRTYSGSLGYYDRNVLSFAHLAPGDFYLRPVELEDSEWTIVRPDGSHYVSHREVAFRGLSEFLKGLPGPIVSVKIRAKLEQFEVREYPPRKTRYSEMNPNPYKFLWYGSVATPWTEVRWLKGKTS